MTYLIEDYKLPF